MESARRDAAGSLATAVAPWDSLPPRQTTNINEVWQVDMGLDFDIGQEWTGEFFLSHGESATYNVAGGNLSLERYRQLARLPDYGRNAKISGNEPPNSLNAHSSVPPTSRVPPASTPRTSWATNRSRTTASRR